MGRKSKDRSLVEPQRRRPRTARILHRGTGSTDYETHAAPQLCQPTPAVELGSLGTEGTLRWPQRSLAACARP
eukprot:scaffold74245_cov84-Phaeocystis_antarctica.AAC.1